MAPGAPSLSGGRAGASAPHAARVAAFHLGASEFPVAAARWLQPCERATQLSVLVFPAGEHLPGGGPLGLPEQLVGGPTPELDSWGGVS